MTCVIEKHKYNDKVVYYAWNADKIDITEYSVYGYIGTGSTPEEALADLMRLNEEKHGTTDREKPS